MIGLRQARIYSIWTALSAVLLAIFLLSSGVANASPYDKWNSKPGTSITNTATVSYGTGGAHPKPFTVSNTFSVTGFNTPATLTALQYAPGNPAATSYNVSTTPFSTGDANGPFTSNTSPHDQNGKSIPYGASTPLIQTDRTLKGNTVFFLLNDPGMNYDSSVRDKITLKVTDAITGDFEYIQMTETGADTGQFIGYLQTTAKSSPHTDGTLTTVGRSQITGTFTDPWQTSTKISTNVMVGPVDPYGVVVDSQTGTPISGTRITIINNATGKPATVYGDDLKSAFPSTVTTGQTVQDSSGKSYSFTAGAYRFPYVDAGSYHYEVTPPKGYVAPSEASAAQLAGLPGGPYSFVAGSKLDTFKISPGGVFKIDIPVDTASQITVTRAGSDAKLQVGDFEQYTVTARTNVSRDVIADIIDTLPPGLSFQKGSVLVNGATPPKPVIISADGHSLRFPGLTIPSGGVVTVTYVAQVNPLAQSGSILKSQSTASAPRFISNVAIHDLGIISTFNRTENIVVGQVYATGCSQSYDPSLDLSGIRILLDNGHYVTTDPDGLFTFRSVPKGAHAISIDPLSLPQGYKPVLCHADTRDAGSALSQFVQAQGGLTQQVFFTLQKSKTSADYPAPHHPKPTDPSLFDAAWLKAHPATRGMIYPTDKMLAPNKAIDVIAARSEKTFSRLYLNGTEVNELNRNQGVSVPAAKAELDAWKGIILKEGANTLRLVTTDLTGKTIRDQSRTVYYNNTIDKIRVVAAQSHLSSDGRSRPIVTFRITNAQGIPLHPGALTTVYVDPPFGFSPRQDGTSANLSGQKDGRKHLGNGSQLSATATVDADGLLRLRMAPSSIPGMATFSIFEGSSFIHTQAYIASKGRPWILVGLASGTAAHDVIAQNMSDLGATTIGKVGKVAINGKAAFYAQGVIKGKYLLTLRYDSTQRQKTDNFFGIDPNADYIVYGDKSHEGDLSPSRAPLYVRLQGKGVDALYGDFDTGLNQGVATYDRRLTGGRVMFGNDTTSLVLFAASEDQAYAKDSFAANGTSGPFQLTHQNIIPFSERVVVQTTDRNDPNQILKTTQLQNGKDYSINYDTGQIFLSDPLDARDIDFNPNALVVQYELSAPTGKGILVGGRFQTKIAKNVTVGINAVHEGSVAGSNGTGNMAGADVTWKLSDNLTASAAVGIAHQSASNTLSQATTEHSALARIDYADTSDSFSAYAKSESSGFGVDNQSTAPQTVISAGGKADVLLKESKWARPDGKTATETLRFQGDATASKNQATSDTQAVTDAMLIKTNNENGLTRKGLGLRSIWRNAPNVADANNARTLKLVGKASWTSADSRLKLEVGQELPVYRKGNVGEFNRGEVKASYALTKTLTVHARNELAFADGLNANITSLGFDYHPWKDGKLSFGTVAATTGGGSHTVGYTAFEQSVHLSTTTEMSFGVEQQHSLAGSLEATNPVVQAGLSDPRLQNGFTTWRSGISSQGKGWASGAKLEYTIGDGHQGRLQLSTTVDQSRTTSWGAYGSLYAGFPATGDFSKNDKIILSYAFRPRDKRHTVMEQLSALYTAAPGLSEGRVIASSYYSFKSRSGNEINLRHGIKFAHFNFANTGQSYSDVLNLVGGEWRHDLSKYFDIGLQGAALNSLHTRTTSWSCGVSFGLTPFKNGWISIGYNFTGFTDPDFNAGGFTDKGAFIQFRVKIDSDSLSSLFVQN